MRVLPMSSVAVRRPAGIERAAVTASRADAPRAEAKAVSLGYLVPRTRRSGCVHSVFARACNIAFDDSLLTLCSAGAAPGPTVLCLAIGDATDFRTLFSQGEHVERRTHGLRTARIAVDFSDAVVWRPAEPPALPSAARLAAHLQRARARIAGRRGPSPASLVDTDGAGAVAALVDACRRLDRETAERQVHRLVGWGEGLTPAGDDFLAGLLAAFDGLEALLSADADRRRFRAALGAACVARMARTTPIAAHQLGLAADGHHAEPLLGLRDALLAADDACRVDAALERVLAIGATSGAATAGGLLAGLEAWLPDGARDGRPSP